MGCNNLTREDLQPVGTVDYSSADNVKILGIKIPHKDTIVPQHSHKYDHTTLIGRGKVRVWSEGQPKDEYDEGDAVYIKAGVKHSFQTLEDNTVLYCIHNIARGNGVEVFEEHEIEEVA